MVDSINDLEEDLSISLVDDKNPDEKVNDIEKNNASGERISKSSSDSGSSNERKSDNSNEKGSGGKNSSGKHSIGKGSNGRGSSGRGSSGRGSSGRGSSGKGSSGRGSSDKGSSGKGSSEKGSSSKDDEEGSSSSGSSLENLMLKIDKDLKICTLLSCVFCMGTISLSLFTSIVQGRVSTFSSKTNALKMNIVMMYIYLIVLDLSNLALFILLLKEKEQMLLKIIYSNLRWFFVLTQTCFGGLFLIGIIWEASNWTYILSASINMSTTLLLAFFFQDIKIKKNMEIGSFLCIYSYLSILFAFISYATFYNFSCILIDNNKREQKYYSIIQIITNLFQTILGIVLLTYFKDVFFAASSFYILFALLVEKKFDISGENLYVVIYLGLLFLSTLISVLKNRKKTFGYEEVYDIEVQQPEKID